MLPRDARNTFSRARSSPASEQNSHAANDPDSSVWHAGHVRRVSSRPLPQTGQSRGAWRCAAIGRLVRADVDCAHGDLDVEGSLARTDGGLVRAAHLAADVAADAMYT